MRLPMMRLIKFLLKIAWDFFSYCVMLFCFVFILNWSIKLFVLSSSQMRVLNALSSLTAWVVSHLFYCILFLSFYIFVIFSICNFSGCSTWIFIYKIRLPDRFNLFHFSTKFMGWLSDQILYFCCFYLNLWM